MRISEAIKKAMNAGWRDNGKVNGTYAKILFDPLFWQALGKEMNWIDERGDGEIIPDWENHWHKFISHLANGGTPDSYFKSLN